MLHFVENRLDSADFQGFCERGGALVRFGPLPPRPLGRGGGGERSGLDSRARPLVRRDTGALLARRGQCVQPIPRAVR
jgi:hypothetical protein